MRPQANRVLVLLEQSREVSRAELFKPYGPGANQVTTLIKAMSSVPFALSRATSPILENMLRMLCNISLRGHTARHSCAM